MPASRRAPKYPSNRTILMAFSDPSLNVIDFALDRVPEPSPEDLTNETSELVFNDDLFAHFARLSGLANTAQLRSARRMQHRLFKSSGSQVNLAELLVMQGAIPRQRLNLLEASFPYPEEEPPRV